MNRNFAVVSFALLSLAPLGRADIVGSDPTVNLGTLDTCSGCLFAYVPFTAANTGQTVLSFQFYNGAGNDSGKYLTPVLLEKNSPQSFTILGIGQSVTGFVAGYNSVNFVDRSGSAKVSDASTYFGYLDGDVLPNGSVTGNTGTITTNYPNASQSSGYPGYFAAPLSALASGDTVTTYSWADVGQNSRTYSLQVTTTPEPAFYGLLMLGLSAGALVVNRRRRQ